VIVAEHLTKRFGTTLAVDDVSFEVHPGQIVGFLGHNGAGKTTTMQMLIGHLRPDEGTAAILGRPYAQLNEPMRHVGVMLDGGMHPARTARNHLRTSAAVGGLPTERIESLLELVGLADDAHRRVGAFSLGMRQRLGLATALLGDPEILILDEPANGLDPEGIRWLRGLLRNLADGGRTVLLSSHQLGEVAQTVDYVVVVDRGAVVASCPLPELLQRAGTEVVVRSPGAEMLAQEFQRAGIATADVSAEEVRARNVPPRVVTELAVATGVPVWEVRSEAPNLEEVFFELTSDRGGADASDPPSDPDGAAEDGEPARARDAKTSQLEDAEASVDRDLDRLPTLGSARFVAVVAPAPALGRTTLSFLLGDVLVATTGLRTLTVSLSVDRGRMAMPVPSDDRSGLTLRDLLRDLPDFDEAARITPYVSVARSGLHTLAGVTTRRELAAVRPELLSGLLDFAARFYELVILDVGDLAEDTMRATLRRADQVVLLSSPDIAEAPDESRVLDALETERSERATIIINQADQAQVDAFAERGDAGPIEVLPQDREMIRALDAGAFALDQLDPATRLALKRIGLLVAQGLR
jgi:ABC-2 type transport system ATP-binding protein